MKDHTTEEDLIKQIKHLEEENKLLRANRALDSMDEIAYRELQRDNRRLKETEGSHQKLNGKLQARVTEVEEDNRKHANQIEDKVNQMRRSGM